MIQKKFFKTEVQICGDCKGEGTIWEQVEPARHGSDTGRREWHYCTTCDSSGRVKVTKDITITIEPHIQTSNE